MFKLMANYGFSMVIAGYLLVRIEPVLRDLRESVVILTSVVARQNNIDIEEKFQVYGGKQ